MIESTAPDGITRALQCLMTRPDATPQLAAFDGPALILVGGQDRLAPVTEAERMHQLIEGSALVVVPSAGHLANLERPVEFNQAIWRFLAERFQGRPLPAAAHSGRET